MSHLYLSITFQLLGNLRIGGYLVNEGRIALFGHLFLYPMMSFTPPAVIDVVVMVSGTRNGHFEEIRILTNGRRTHESATRMAMNAHFVNINEGMALSQLFDGVLMVGQRIVAHVSIAKIMIPLATARMASTLTYRNDDETGLCQSVEGALRAVAVAAEDGSGLGLRA